MPSLPTNIGATTPANDTVLDHAQMHNSENALINAHDAAIATLQAGGTKAPLDSPTFTGTPTASTATAGTNTTQLATTAFVQTATATGTPDATSSIKGKIQLAGDLGGTASSPLIKNVAKVFNLVDYGGIGDDSTDNATAYAAIKTAVVTAGGGEIYIPKGRYRSSIPLGLASNFTIRGDGKGKTVLVPTASGGNGDGIRYTASVVANYITNVRITDLTVDSVNTYVGSPLGTADFGSYSNGMSLQGINNLSVERVSLLNQFGFGIFTGVQGAIPVSDYPKELSFRDIYIEGERNGNDGIGGGNVSNLTIENLYAYNCYGSATDITNINGGVHRNIRSYRDNASASSAYGIGIGLDHGGVDVEYENIFIDGGLRGFAMGNFTGTNIPTSKNLSFRNVHIKNVQREALQFVNAINDPFYNVTLHNVTATAWNGATGINGIQFTDITGLRMTDCSLLSPQNSAYAVFITSAGGTAQGVTKGIIRNNDFTGTGVLINGSLDPTSIIRLDNNLGYVSTTDSVTKDGTQVVAGQKDFTASVGIGISTTPAKSLEINGSGIQLEDNLTDATNKNGIIVTKPYTNANNPTSLVAGQNTAGNNKVFIGGGITGVNASTDIHFYTASSTNTAVGTEKAIIDGNGRMGIGVAIPTTTLDVAGTVNATGYAGTATSLTINGGSA